MDDTIYFLPCQSEEEADFVMSLWSSRSPTWHLSGPWSSWMRNARSRRICSRGFPLRRSLAR